MHTSSLGLVFTSLCLPAVYARVLGPIDPAPVDISSNSSAVRTQWNNLTSTLEGHLSGKEPVAALSGLENITFSLGLFSLHDCHATSLQYHHTGPDVRNSTYGVKKVDGNSIYRVASMTKVMTVYAGLLLLDPKDWNKPMTEIFPEVASLPQDDPVHHIQWNTITPFSLASQISGVPANARPFDVGEISTALYGANIDPTTLGLPPVTVNSTGLNVPCKGFNCTGVEYIKSMQAPTLPVFQSPGYANTNFILLGRVISKLTGLSQNEQWFRKALFDPLGMKSTSSVSPTKKPYAGYVVAGPVTDFAYQGEITSSSGGIFSSTNDIAKLGFSMLNSSLLPADQTRKWMKPNSFTATPDFALGLGWEIYRYTDKVTGHIHEFYTKLGDAGAYASYLVIIPNYDFGFSVMTTSGIVTSAQRSAAAHLLADLVSETLMPALRDQAVKETKKNYAGTYSATGKGESSMILAYNETEGAGFGLTLTSLVSDGKDLLAYMKRLYAAEQLVLAPATIDPKTGQRGFEITPVVPDTGDYTGLFSKMFATDDDWLNNNGVTYGGQAIGTFYINVAKNDSVVSILPAVLRGKTYYPRGKLPL
ncbi:beta-lactamase/transpeptidase-like protein [Nemania sp. FL0916]|nr:beta-lactamase/transpeptidase-like protein [Nemania sp. FL0916]